MAVLLCRQQAERPYRIPKLDVRIWNEQELCFLIGTYPQIFLEDFPGEGLLTWLAGELHLEYLAEKLAAFRNGSESPANLMLYFLQNCNYYNQQELSDFRKRLLLFERMSRAERLHAEALALFSAGRLSQAYDRLKGARDALNTDLTRTEDPAEKAELLKRKAGYYCDMAAVCLRLFEDKKAEDLLHSSELYAKLPRARLMLGLMGRAENLSEEEQAAVDARLSECRKKALSSESYQKTADLFDRDRIRAGQEAGERIRAWQNDYRRML